MIIISNADFPTINPDEIQMIVAHLKDKQDSNLNIDAYFTTLNFLKDHITEFFFKHISSFPSVQNWEARCVN